MKRLILILAVLAAATHAQASELNMRGRFVPNGNDGTCINPILKPVPANVTNARIHFKWDGPSFGEDSVVVTPGDFGALTVGGVLPGRYNVHAWPSWFVEGYYKASDCRDSVAVTLYPMPWRVFLEDSTTISRPPLVPTTPEIIRRRRP